MDQDTEITLLLKEACENRNSDSEQRLMDRVHTELHRLASYMMRGEQHGHTLQPTALVNEVYLRLFSGQQVDWKGRAHFFAIAARQMRNVLVDHARRKKAGKRGSGAVKVSLDQANDLGTAETDFDSLDFALSELEKMDSRAAKVVELRFFGGLSDKEVAEVLSMSFASVRRDWEFARTWLHSRLS